MDNATSIKGLIQDMTGGEVQIYQGTVTSVNPLRIQIVNDSSLQISDANTYIPRHLTDYTTTVDISGGGMGGEISQAGEHTHSASISIGSAGAHTHSLSGLSITGASMTVHNALKVGDQVHLLSMYNGKQYYVLDRV